MKTAKKEKEKEQAKEGLKVRPCLKCDEKFESEGPHNRLCPKCNAIIARVDTGGCIPMARWRVKRANG